MSIIGGQAEAALAREMMAFIEKGELEAKLGRPLTDEDRKVLAPILEKLKSAEASGEGGW
jgi:hypothetical protein